MDFNKQMKTKAPILLRWDFEISLFKTVTLDAEPNAERFYLKFGFKTVDQLASSIPNRFLPVMELDLTK